MEMFKNISIPKYGLLTCNEIKKSFQMNVILSNYYLFYQILFSVSRDSNAECVC